MEPGERVPLPDVICSTVFVSSVQVVLEMQAEMYQSVIFPVPSVETVNVLAVASAWVIVNHPGRTGKRTTALSCHRQRQPANRKP